MLFINLLSQNKKNKVTAKEKRLIVYKKCGGHCCYCGKDIEYKDMQVDHMAPLHKNKNNDIENLWPACKMCNHYKRGFDLERFRNLILTLHERIESNYINKVGIDFGIITVKPFDGIFYFEKQKQQ